MTISEKKKTLQSGIDLKIKFFLFSSFVLTFPMTSGRHNMRRQKDKKIFFNKFSIISILHLYLL